MLSMDNILVYWSPQNHAFGGQLCRLSKRFRSLHKIAVQNVHISLGIRIDVYCQKLGYLGRFLLDNCCVGARGSAASRCRGARGGTGDAHAGSRGRVSPGLVSSSLSMAIYMGDGSHLVILTEGAC